jgi:LacI family transcriptional regulator
LVQRRDEVEQQEFEHILGQNLPVILINTRGSKRGSVVVDDVAATQVATQHLLDLGHRDLGFVGGVPVSYTGRVRAKGFAQTLSHNGIRRRTAWTTSLGYSPQAGYEAGLSLLQGVRRPTGLVVANINAALGVVRAAHQLGLSLPDDVSIVAIHDNWQSQYVTPELTAVQLPLYELGRVAVQQLIGRLAGESAADVMVSDPAPVLTVRNTSGPPP